MGIQRYIVLLPVVALLEAGCSDCQSKFQTWRQTRHIQCPSPESDRGDDLEVILVDDVGNVELFKDLGVSAHAARGVEMGTDGPLTLNGRDVHPYYLAAQDPEAISEFLEDADVKIDAEHRLELEKIQDPASGKMEYRTWYLVGDPAITQEHMSQARALVDPAYQQPVVMVDLTEEGAQEFASFTAKHVGERVAILVGGHVVSAPLIREKIPGGRIQIMLGPDGDFEKLWCQALDLERILDEPVPSSKEEKTHRAQPAQEPDEETADPCPSENIEAFFTTTPEGAMGMAAHICEYPDGMKEMLRDLGNATPDQRLALVAKYVVTNMQVLENVCPGAEEVFRSLANVPLDEKSAWLHDSCKLGDLGLATKEEVSEVEPSRVLASSIAFGWMKDQGVVQARKICRHMMGVE